MKKKVRRDASEGGAIECRGQRYKVMGDRRDYVPARKVNVGGSEGGLVTLWYADLEKAEAVNVERAWPEVVAQNE